MNIKNIIIGVTLLLTSAVLYGAALISASVYSLVLTRDGGEGWDRRYGVFGTALIEVGTLPLSLAVLAGVIGLTVIYTSFRKK
ncbi:phosphatase [Bacillus salacetis]|uniref:phosphatase n=1 Tax=Bacillus salacetis TaxID=2315464 RepID=UPI003BA0402C